MSEKAQTEAPERQANTISAGVMLREARLATKLSIEEVAEELHLATDVVEALEKGDTEKLPSRVFTLGYLKNYAKLVNVPFEDAKAAFDDMAEEEIPVLNQPRAPSIRRQARSGGGGGGLGWLIKSFFWFLLLGGVLVAFLWWKGEIRIPGLGGEYPFGRESDNLGQESSIQSTEIDTGTVGELSVTLDPESNQQLLVNTEASNQASDTVPLAAEESAIPADAQSVPESPGEPVALENSEETGAPVASTETSPLATPDMTLEEESTVSTDEIEIPVTVLQNNEESPLSSLPSIMPAVDMSEPATAEAVSETAESQSVALQDGIQIDFSGRCWVQVTDGSGKVILSGEMKAGDSKAIGGQGPLRFVLGNAKVVSMTVNSETFDLGPHTSGNVARFTLKASEG